MLQKNFNPHFNNRMTVYQRVTIPKRRLRHAEIKDGKRVWVDGPKLNPFKGVDANELSLFKRIENGTFQTMEGSPRKLEKAQGSDIIDSQVAQAQADFKARKDERAEKEAKERRKKEAEEIVNSMKNNSNNNSNYNQNK